MSDQPAHDAAGSPDKPDGGFSGAPGKPDPDVSASDATPDPVGPDPTARPDLQLERTHADRMSTEGHGNKSSDFGRFDWFADSEDFGRRPVADADRDRDRPLGSADSGSSQIRGGEHRPRGWWRWRRTHDAEPPGWPWPWPGDGRHWLSGWRLVGAAAGLTLASAAVGGVIGGFVAISDIDGLADPTYSVGLGPPGSANEPANSVAGVAARDTPGVVMIKVDGSAGTGSGFVIQGGYIVTDNHVVTLDGLVTSAAIRVYFSNGKSAAARLVGGDPYSDIAVIKATGVTDLPALTLGNSRSVAVGDPVIAIGSPLGLADTVTSGIVSAVNRPVHPGSNGGSTPQAFFDAIQTDAPINPGNSGGPLVNARGQVIGVDAAIDTLGNDPITGTQGGSIGLGFAIPVNQARRIIVELIRTGHATHSVLGASLNESYGGAGAQIMTSHRGGRAITPGGPAARAGLRPGDVITKLGIEPIPNAYSLLDAIRSLPPGSTISLAFSRRGQPMVARITLGSGSLPDVRARDLP